MAGYNGWSNYETWNVALWWNNDRGLYGLRLVWLRARKPRQITSGTVEDFVRKIQPFGTRDLYDRNVGKEDRYEGVNWAEIARAWKEDKRYDAK